MDTPTQNPTIVSEGNQPTETTAQVQQSASELVAKHRKQRADKGKPRGARKDEVAPSSNLAPSDPLFQLNVELVKKSVTALVSTVDTIVVRRIYNKSKALGADDGVAQEYAHTAGLSKNEAEIISECTASIMARSDFLIRHAPEVMLGCVVISYSVRVVGTLKRLDELEAQMKAAKSKKNVTPLEPRTSE